MRVGRSVSTELRGLVAAVAFLTRIPLGRRVAFNGLDVARGGMFFPLIGAGVGAAVGGVTTSLAPRATPWLAAGIALAVGTVLTGALHLDGLADTADALGAHTRERALGIMRDHAVGAYGVVALVLSLLIKAAALTALTESGNVVLVSIAASSLARAAPVVLAAVLPYARSEGGAGESLTQSPRWRAVAAAAISVAIAVLVAGRLGVLLAGAAVAVGALSGIAFRSWLGGVTGDTFGATIELIELTTLSIAAVVH